MGTITETRTEAATEPRRHLPLEGTYNLRDTGGYATEHGDTVRWRTLLRGDSLHKLTEAGQAELVAAGLRTVIDLRRDTELALAPNVFAASNTVRYLNVPLIESTPHEAENAAPRTLATIYEQIIAASHGRIREIFAALAEPGAFPALVHCTAGKDRTGIIIALLLGVAGVPAETIVADYALTEALLAGEWVEQVKARVVASGGDWARVELLMGSPADLMRHVLADIAERYGDVPQYLLAIGVPQAHLDAVRTALLTTDAAQSVATGAPQRSVTFVHLTDTHVQPTEASRFLGVDTTQTLRDTLALLHERGVLPDAAVIISGDLVNNGEPESYARLRTLVDELRGKGVAVHLALGNHDDRAVFRRVMLDEPEADGAAKYHYTAMLGGLRLVVLDSHEIGTHGGSLGAEQLAWLRGELATPAPEGTVIVVHHPPTTPPRSPSSQMLGDADALRNAIAGTDVVGIVAGHTHVAAVELVGAVPCVSAPGTAFLLDVTVSDGMRFLDGGGINLITVSGGTMTAKSLALPRSGRELHHHRPGDPIETLRQAIHEPAAEPASATA